VEARVLRDALGRKPTNGSTHWSTCKLAARSSDVPASAVQRIWRSYDVPPHQLEREMVSNDREFEIEAAEVNGLYLNPSAHTVVFCADEKTAIQALARKDRMLPLSPKRAEGRRFGGCRHNNTLSLFAALNRATGEWVGKSTPRQTNEQFVPFLTHIVAHQRIHRGIHVIYCNVSSHKTKRVHEFLTEHRDVHIHFMPTYSSWLNQVENWFSRIQRDVISPRHLHLGEGPRSQPDALHPRTR
jgi:transposase